MLDPVTNRYAEALFNLARAGGALERVQGDVRRLSGEFASAAVSAFFFDARVSPEARQQKLDPLLRGMHDMTRNFVRLLFDKRREEVLRGLGEAFHRRALTEAGAAEGVVESARPLGDAELRRLEAALSGRLSKRVELKSRLDPTLIGGVRVIVESRMIDASLSGRLEGLRKRMREAPLPSLQEG